MTPVSIGVLAVTMSLDAFAASVGKGAGTARPDLRLALRNGAIFGGIEALTPLLGWMLGATASRHVAAVDHWVAFALLSGVGLHMLLAAQRAEPAPSRGLWRTVVVALGTSVDALAVGISLAFLNVNILLVAAVIGCTSAAFSIAGMLAGHRIGSRFGKLAEAGGGAALIVMGAAVLMTHIGAAG